MAQQKKQSSKGLLYLVLILINSSLFSQEFKREKYNFNADWKLKTGDFANAESPVFDDADWRKVTLPHAYNQEEAFRKRHRRIDHRHRLVPKKIQTPQRNQGQKSFWNLQGIRQGGVIYVNGQKVGLHENGVMAFGFDVSNIVKPFPEEKYRGTSNRQRLEIPEK